MRTLTIVVAAAALSLAACKKKDSEQKPAAGSGSAVAGSGSAGSGSAAAGSGSAAAGGGSAAGSAAADAVDPGMSNKAGNCPSAVTGAVSAVTNDPAKPEVVMLSITAKDAAATTTIRSRASHLVEVQGAPDAEVKHGGEGTGGGGGMCPVVTEKDVKIESAEIEGGVKVTMTPSGALTAAALTEEVTKRIAKLEQWRAEAIKPTDASGGGGGAGGGKGEHGGNHSGDGDGKGKDEKQAPPPPGEKPVTPTVDPNKGA